MRIQRTFSLLVALLTVLWVSEPASAQRRGSSSSQGQSSGSSRSGSVSPGSSGGSRASGSVGGSVTRSGGSRVGSSSGSSVSRSSVSYGRPSSSGSSSSSGRPTTTVIRSTGTTTVDRSSTSRSTSSPPVIVRSEPRTIDRGESTVRDWSGRSDSSQDRGVSSRGSEPVRDARVIDITDVALPPRVGFPQPAGGQRSSIDSRDLTRELRSRGTSASLADLRRRSAGAPTQMRTPSVSREDILRRYQGSSSRTDAFRESPPPSTDRDPRLQRRDALGRPSLSEGRRGRDDDSAAASRIAAARAQREAQDAGRVARAREEQKAQQADRVAAARADYLAKRADRISKARANYTGSLRDKFGDGQGGDGEHGDWDDDDWDDDGHHDGHHDHSHHLHHSFWGYYGGHCWGYWGWGWAGTAWCWSWWWHSYWYWGGYWYPHHQPYWYWYGPFLPWHVSVIYQTVDDGDPEVIYVEDPEPEVIYVEQPPAGEQVVVEDDAAQSAVPVPASGGGVNRAAEYYLSLGDRAFRDGRYADAVHFYAKSVEFAPEEGILYLILSDALFCTGDYHYAAYALRRAFELDPLLATSVVDKRSFYADPAEFDRQVAVLETYLEDHFVDDDARLVLAANYLFGGRPAAAVDLLENPFSAEVKGSQVGQLLLEAAKAIQYGTDATEEAKR